MEQRIEFNLETAVSEYIAQINQSQLLTSEETDEIRDHLMTEYESLLTTELSEKEAFEVSVMRMGKAKEIRKEYSKAKPLQTFYKFIFVSGFIFSLINFIFSALPMVIGPMQPKTGIAESQIGYWTIGTSISVPVIIVVLFYISKRIFTSSKTISINKLFIVSVFFLLFELLQISSLYYFYQTQYPERPVIENFQATLAIDAVWLYSFAVGLIMVFCWIKIRKQKYIQLAV